MSKKGSTVLLVHIFESGVDVLQKNNLLYKLPTKGKFSFFKLN
jgi:hypothetical protein